MFDENYNTIKISVHGSTLKKKFDLMQAIFKKVIQ